MIKNAVWIMCAGICLLISVSAASALSPEESLKKSFPSIRADSVTPSGIPGLYEIISGQQIFYYSPETECIVGGPIVMKGGRNLTEEKFRDLERKRLSAMVQKLKDLPLDKALKIGSGKHTVIEITNPDCSYCRVAAQFFQTRSDVTKYVFFFPLAVYEHAERKFRHILCAKDKANAYREAMAGKLDDMKFEVCQGEEVDTLIEAHKEATARLGVTATPLFFINGQPVVGADIRLIEKFLGTGR